MMKRGGPRTEPWGTPEMIGEGSAAGEERLKPVEAGARNGNSRGSL